MISTFSLGLHTLAQAAGVPRKIFANNDFGEGHRLDSMSIPGILVLRSRNLSSASNAKTITR